MPGVRWSFDINPFQCKQNLHNNSNTEIGQRATDNVNQSATSSAAPCSANSSQSVSAPAGLVLATSAPAVNNLSAAVSVRSTISSPGPVSVSTPSTESVRVLSLVPQPATFATPSISAHPQTVGANGSILCTFAHGAQQSVPMVLVQVWML